MAARREERPLEAVVVLSKTHEDKLKNERLEHKSKQVTEIASRKRTSIPMAKKADSAAMVRKMAIIGREH